VPVFHVRSGGCDVTNGPSATIGQVLNIPLPRPRNLHELRESKEYYELRNQALDFLERYQ
jgi:nitrate/nitrite transport system ATP-binding protein